MIDPIRVSGVDIERAMFQASAAVREAASEAAVEAAELVADKARGLVPRGPSGAARASLRAMGAKVQGGGSRAPYFPFLDFGGRVGIKGSVRRRFIQGGRYIWPTLDAETERINDEMSRALVRAVEASGIEVN